MTFVGEAVFYIFSFLAVYMQVFFLVTFLENKEKMVTRRRELKLREYPSVTIIVPCWNEEKTVEKTVNSLLKLNYPKEKLYLTLINDGSTDNTLEVLQKFSGYKNIKIFTKENGGKHTALNFGIENSDTEFIGCLDADSIVDREALLRIMDCFKKDSELMAVTPSIIVNDPKNFIQKAQSFEHFITVFIRKIHGLLGAMTVLPGPFSIYKKRVFDELGLFREAYNLEDTEIAYRMQKHRYKIDDCHDAYVYTNMPATIPKLYRQRLRWIYGIINNMIDYRSLILNKKYGDFSLLVVPANILFMFSALYAFFIGVYNLADFVISNILKWKLTSFTFVSHFGHWGTFFIPTNSSLIILLLLYGFIILTSAFGRKIVENKWVFSFDVFYFFLVFTFVSPFWLLRAVYNTLISKKPAWR